MFYCLGKYKMTNSCYYTFFSDIDECTESVDDCTQLCTNTPGGFNCSCSHTYTLSDDGRTCIGE